MNPTSDADEGRGSQPASDLGEVWDALDALPRASAPVDMAATTIDMAAVTAERSPASGTIRSVLTGVASSSGWLWPAVAVAVSLVGGVVLGRLAAPDPDARVLEYLPVIRHFGLLREAGSVAFLKDLAARRNQQPQRMPPEMLRVEQEEFDAALADLEQDHACGTAGRSLVADRRTAIAMMDDADRDAIERSAATFQELSATERRDLVAVAAALADPQRDEVRAAARLWHLLIAASDPPDRKNIVDLDAASRLEWLERRSRMRDWMIERRGQPPADGQPPRGPLGGPGAGPGIGPGGGPPAGPPGEGRPRWQGPRGDGPRGDGPRGEGPPGGRGEGRMRGEPGGRGEAGPRGEPGPRRPDGSAPPE